MTLKDNFNAWWKPSPEAHRAKYARKAIRNRRIENAFVNFMAIIITLVIVIYFIRHPAAILWSILIFGGSAALLCLTALLVFRPRGRK
jgi:hypothetical protein